jgi:hypothetical protein
MTHEESFIQPTPAEPDNASPRLTCSANTRQRGLSRTVPGQ